MECKVCNTDIPETAIRCPNCKTPLNVDLLSTTSEKSLLDRAVTERLARSISSSLLERADTLSRLSDEIERKTINSLTTTDLQGAITHLKRKSTLDLVELENILALNPDDITLEGITLAGLLDGKGNDLEILKKGLVFLKHRRYVEANEWWSLNRQRIDLKQQKLQFLLLIMEAFTHTLSEDNIKAEQIRKKIREHCLYERYKRNK
jgi:hypothetical protein